MTAAAPLPPPLHPRLTVVRLDARAAATAGEVAAAIANHTGAETIDARTVLGEATVLASRAHEARMAERAAAAERRAALAARRTELLERAEWCETTGGTARVLEAAAAEAAARAAAARAQVEEATARRDRVAEQRAAAAQAVEEARLELEGLDGAALDETGVRREIEAATRAEQQAAAVLEEAEAELGRLHERLREVVDLHQDLIDERAVLAAEREAPGGAANERLVREALELYDELASRTGPDPGATALADAIGRIDAELASLREQTPEPPTDADLEQAEYAVATARRNLDVARAAAAAFDGPPPEWWVELNAIHAEVVDAETALLQASGFRKGAARRRYEEALAAEHARLDELGFASYLDALMSGGRLPEERAEDEAAVEQAMRALADAERRLEALRTDLLAGAPIVERLAERERLLEVATGLLGTDPGDRVLELLAEHPAVPPMAIGELADALRAVGVPTAGIGVAAAARQWLAARDAANDPARLEDLDRRIAELAAERQELERQVDAAHAHVERVRADAATAARAVANLEAELQARAGDDGRLLERAAAARELRDHVEALEARLVLAEADALEAWTVATEALAEADAEQQRLERELAELRRKASRTAAELPPERRPAFDVVSGLVALGGALRAEAAALADEIPAADAALAVAEAAVAAGPGVPTPQDVEGGLVAVLAGGPAPAVLAEPFAGLPVDDVEPLLDVLLRASANRAVVVVTADLTVVGWAIGLPAETGALVPARSVEAALAEAACPD